MLLVVLVGSVVWWFKFEGGVLILMVVGRNIAGRDDCGDGDFIAQVVMWIMVRIIKMMVVVVGDEDGGCDGGGDDVIDNSYDGGEDGGGG